MRKSQDVICILRLESLEFSRKKKKKTHFFEYTENIIEWCATIMSQHLENNTDRCVENKANENKAK